MTGFELQTLESEATALPTEPQPLPLWKHMIAVFSINLSWAEGSVTRLGENSSIRHIFESLWLFLEFYFFAKMFNLRWHFYAAI